MNRFAALLDALVFTPSRNGKLKLLRDHFAEVPDPERGWALAALTGGIDLPSAKPAMIRALAGSVASMVVVPMQDVLGLDGSHRMNVPGLTECWTWRFAWPMVEAGTADMLARIGATFGRGRFDRLGLG